MVGTIEQSVSKYQYSQSLLVPSPTRLRHGETGNKNYATCLATLLQNVLNSDVARFTTHIKRAVSRQSSSFCLILQITVKVSKEITGK